MCIRGKWSAGERERVKGARKVIQGVASATSGGGGRGRGRGVGVERGTSEGGGGGRRAGGGGRGGGGEEDGCARFKYQPLNG